MNVDHILQTMNDKGVEYLLIGGMNFLLRHEPVTTFDVDLWIADTQENCRRCESALAALDAQWGKTDEDWGPVAEKPEQWLHRQAIFCLTSPHGAIDIFRDVRGLDDWQDCANRAPTELTSNGTSYRGLADADMLQSQLALEKAQQKQDRIAALRRALGNEDERQ